MKVEASSAETTTKSKKYVSNGEADGKECPKDGSKRSRSRSKSPRNTFSNGELMFDAALYAPERPKRNRKKPEEEIFTPVLDTFSKQARKRKINDKNNKKKPDLKPNKSTGKHEADCDSQPKAKRKYIKKKVTSCENSDNDEQSDKDDSSHKSSKSVKESAKCNKKTNKKGLLNKDSALQNNSRLSRSGRKVTKPSERDSSLSEEEEEEQEDHIDDVTDEDSCLSPNKGANAGKPKKKQSLKSSLKSSSDTDVTSTPKCKDRASKVKKSPATIEIDGIEITELSDLNSSREDDFNSSRDSLTQLSGNETSIETVLYESKENASQNDGANLDLSDSLFENGSAMDCKKPDRNTQFTNNHTSSPSDEQSTKDSPLNDELVPSTLSDAPNNAVSFGSTAESPSNSSPTKADPAPDALLASPKSEGLSGEQKLTPCPHPGCKYQGKNGVLLRKHLRNHGVYECAHCKFSAPQFELLQSHMHEFHPTRWGRKKCKKCCRHIRLDYHEEHEETCDGTKIWKCDDCQQEFPYESMLKEHRKKHKQRPQIQCDKCEFKCEYKQHMKIHIETFHPDESKCKDFICEKCNRGFSSPKHLESHMQCHDERSFACDQCPRVYKSEQSLLNHKYTHQPEALLKCEVEGCDMVFQTPRMLNSHKKQVHKIIVSGNMVKCDFEGCNMEFHRKSELKKHIGIHTGERRFHCDWDGCNKTFRHNANLKIHYMQHTGEKPIKCEHCHFSCRQRSSILFHMKTKHPGLPIPRTERGRSPRQDGSMTPSHNQCDPAETIYSNLNGDTTRINDSVLYGIRKDKTEGITADPNVYDFPDDDEEDANKMGYTLGKKPVKSPLTSLTEMENRLRMDEQLNMSCEVENEVDEQGEIIETEENIFEISREENSFVNNSVENSFVNSSVENVSEQRREDDSSEPSKENSDEHFREEDLSEQSVDQCAESSTDSFSENNTTKDDQKEEEKEQPVSIEAHPGVVSDTASQNSSKFSEFVTEHVSENFPLNSSRGTTPGELQQMTPLEDNSVPSQESDKDSKNEQHCFQAINSTEIDDSLTNPIQGALDTTDDLDYQIDASETDAIDEKMLRSPMSNISEDMRALENDLPNVMDDDKTRDLIKEADLAMSPSKKEHCDPSKISGMPPEIDAEVDQLLESGFLDANPSKHAKTDGPDVASLLQSDPQGILPQPSLQNNSNPDTPTNQHFTPTYNYSGSCEQQQSNSTVGSQHGSTPERNSFDPITNRYPLPDYPPVSTFSAVSQTPSIIPFAPHIPVSSSSTSSSENISTIVSTASTSVSSLPTFPGLPPVTTSSNTFLDVALSGHSIDSSRDMFSSLPGIGPRTTDTTTVTSSSTSFTSCYPSSRDLFGPYFPAPDPMSSLSHLSQEQRSALPYPTQQAGFQALHRASASSLPSVNYPGVSESLARLNPTLSGTSQQTGQSWMTAEERSRQWPAQASSILMQDRNPFSASRPEYNFESQLSKRTESAFPGVPQTMANPTPTDPHRYDVGAYMAGAAHFNSASFGRNPSTGMPDYRTALGQNPIADVYGRAIAASAPHPPHPPHLGLDKYYPYSRDTMYSQHSSLSSNPFMPPPPTSSSTQMTGYGNSMYPGHQDTYSKYLPGQTSLTDRSDFFQPPRPPSDPYDPYRRSVIHNMMTRYF